MECHLIKIGTAGGGDQDVFLILDNLFSLVALAVTGFTVKVFAVDLPGYGRIGMEMTKQIIKIPFYEAQEGHELGLKALIKQIKL